MSKRNVWLFLFLCVLLTACAGMTAAQVGATTAGTAGALLAFVESLRSSGLIDEVKAAQLTAIVANVGDGIGSLLKVVDVVANAAREAKVAALTPQGPNYEALGLVFGGSVAASAAAVRALRGPATQVAGIPESKIKKGS